MQIAHQQSLWSAGMQSATEGTTSHAETSDTNDGFLRRPVKIATFAWQVNTPLWHTFNPWSTFCQDPRVANRLAHFKNLRMNLHVQFLINGNPFYYGRAIASYIPLPDGDNFSTTEPSDFLQLVPSSQRPHVYLDPCKSEGGELVLPFLFPKTYLDIPSEEWDKMGIIALQDINPLLHANEQGDSVDITVFAFASEVSLNTPTCRAPTNLVPQGNDEYGKISYPAHLISNWAGRLSNAPVIGAYARATQMVASTVAGVASMFGYSRANTPAEEIVTVRPYPGHATTNERDDAVTLAVDSKREVTIDPRVVGLAPNDEMALVPLAMRESYFGVIPWNTDNTPDEHLCSIRVSPMLGNSTIIGTERYAMTPMAWVAAPFQYWKGSIIVRMQVVCSAYHRGRLRVVWDPDHCNDNCADMFNTNYSMILDITESQDITFKIGWGANTDYLPVPDYSLISNCLQYANYDTNEPGCNGTLSVYVVNGLTCPGSISTPVEINLFACAAEDFEVAVPCGVKMTALVADATVGPPGAPTDGPGSVPPPPPDNTLIVQKREFSLGMLYENNGISGYPRGTNYNNQVQRTWTNGVRTFKVPAYGGGSTNVTQGDITVEFLNHEATAKDVELIIGGVSATGTIAPNIGATLSLTIPNVTLAAGYQELDATIEVSTGNLQISHVTSYYPQSFERVFVRGNDLKSLIAEGSATVVAIGSYDAVQNGTSAMNIQAPSNHAVGTKAFVTSRYGFALNGIDSPGTGQAFSMTYQNHVAAPLAVGDLWTLTQGASDGAWVSEAIKMVHWIDTTLPAPQGVVERVQTPGLKEDFSQFLEAIAEAELEDIEDFCENIEPSEPAPQGNICKRLGFKRVESLSSFQEEMEKIDYYVSPPSSEDEKEEEIPTAVECELVPQGDDTPEERNDDKDDANAPEHEVVDLAMGPSSDVPGLQTVYFGEQCTSWRQLLKRYHCRSYIAPSGQTWFFRWPSHHFFAGGVNGGHGVTYFEEHLINYVKPAYVCQRGGVKYRFFLPGEYTDFIVNRECYSPGKGFEGSNSFSYGGALSFSGNHIFSKESAGTPAFEDPWYSRYRFTPARSAQLEDTANYVERDFVRISMRGNIIGSVGVSMAAAEDYSLSGFLAVPFMKPSA